MRKLTIMEHSTLDGVIQHSADGGDFAYGDWSTPYRSAEGRDAVMAAHAERFDLLLGRRTYDLWSEYWPKAPSSPLSDGLNAAVKHVVTHRPESLQWGPSVGLSQDLVEDVRRVKGEDGPDLILWGSSTLTSTLLERGLVDELLLIVYPLLLGVGKRFVSGGTVARAMELVRTQATATGVLLNRYRVVGTVEAG